MKGHPVTSTYSVLHSKIGSMRAQFLINYILSEVDTKPGAI